MSFKDLTPEQRAAMRAKAAATRAAKKAAKSAGAIEQIVEAVHRRYDEPAPAALEQKVGLDSEALARIRREAKEYVEKQIAEREALAQRDLIAKVKDDEIARLRREAGLESHLDDIIEYTPNVPPFGDRFVIDGTEYHHGYTVFVRRRVYDVLREQEARGWTSEDMAGNPNKKYYRRPEAVMGQQAHRSYWADGTQVSRETTFSAFGGGVTNAPINNLLAGGLQARRI